MPVLRTPSWWRGVWHAPVTPMPTPWSTCRRCGLVRDDRRHDREAADFAGAGYVELDVELEDDALDTPAPARPRPRKRQP